jgi:hypothetical protein
MANLHSRHRQVRKPRGKRRVEASPEETTLPFSNHVLTPRCSRVLKPGGWVQMVEIYFNVQSDNGSLTDEHALRKWSTQYMRALEDRKELRIGSRLRNFFETAGLVEVDTKMIPLPLSAWSNGQSCRYSQQAGMRTDSAQTQECEPLDNPTARTSSNCFDPWHFTLSHNGCTCRRRHSMRWWRKLKRKRRITR